MAVGAISEPKIGSSQARSGHPLTCSIIHYAPKHDCLALLAFIIYACESCAVVCCHV